MVDDAASRSAVTVYEPVAAVSRQIRYKVHALLTGWGIAADVVEDAVLVVEELVANVIDHARTRFQLAVRMTGKIVHVAVRDYAADLPQVRPFDPGAARGRGLQVVATVACDWGCDRHDRGKTVWADLAV